MTNPRVPSRHPLMLGLSACLLLSSVACGPSGSAEERQDDRRSGATDKETVRKETPPEGSSAAAERSSEPVLAAGGELSSVAVAPVKPPLELLDRISHHYSSPSEDRGSFGRAAPQPDGWHVELGAAGRRTGSDKAWGGYCWEISPIDASEYEEIRVEFSSVEDARLIEIKLEQPDSRIYQRVLRLPQVPAVSVPLSSYQLVAPKLARVCLMLLGELETKRSTTTAFTVSSISLR